MTKSIYITLGSYGLLATDTKVTDKDQSVVTDAGEYFINFSRQSKISHMSGEVSIAELPASDLMFSIDNQKLQIDNGVAVVLAPTQWGKTVFVSRVLTPSLVKDSKLQSSDVLFVSFVEPFEVISFGSELPEPSIYWCDNHESLLVQLLLFLVSSKRVLILDSIRPFVYDASVGGTAAGGMDAYLPVQMTALSNLFARFGKLMIMTVNPMLTITTEDDRLKYLGLQQKIESSVPAVFTGILDRTLDVALRGVSNQTTAKMQLNVPSVDLSPRVQAVAQGPSFPQLIQTDFATKSLLSGTIGNL